MEKCLWTDEQADSDTSFISSLRGDDQKRLLIDKIVLFLTRNAQKLLFCTVFKNEIDTCLPFENASCLTLIYVGNMFFTIVYCT